MNSTVGPLVFFMLVLFGIIGMTLLVIGCETDTSGICYNADKEISHVVSIKIDVDICSCGKSCSYKCYNCLVKVKYENITCQIIIGSYRTEEQAEHKLEKHFPEGKAVDIIVGKNSCYYDWDTKDLVIAGIVLLSIAELILLLYVLYVLKNLRVKDYIAI